MQNVDIKKDGKKIVITIDTSKDLGLSKSKKSINIATTEGNAPIGDGIVLGLNCYRKNPKYSADDKE